MLGVAVSVPLWGPASHAGMPVCGSNLSFLAQLPAGAHLGREQVMVEQGAGWVPAPREELPSLA